MWRATLRRRLEDAEYQPVQGGAGDHEHRPPHHADPEERVDDRPLEPELPQHAVTLGHPVPRSMGDDRRENDRPHALGDDVAEQPSERGDYDDEYEQLTELDANVERQERGQQMRAGELQRRAQREREAEAVHETEGEGNHPTTLERRACKARRGVRALGALRAWRSRAGHKRLRPPRARRRERQGRGRGPARVNDVLERHVDDRGRDQRLDERREPQRVGREVVRRGNERDRMRNGERRHDRDKRPETAEWNHQAEQEQQVIDAVEDVEGSELDELQRGLTPARRARRRRAGTRGDYPLGRARCRRRSTASPRRAATRRLWTGPADPTRATASDSPCRAWRGAAPARATGRAGRRASGTPEP